MTLFRTVTSLALSLWCLSALALPDDRTQTITIESNSAERDQKTGLTQYQGNVVINQGSLVIEADQVTVYYKDNKVSRIVCLGLPASYQQQAAADGGLIIAKAETIVYLLAEDEINLKSNAVLSRNGTLIKGDSINYDLENETWKAKGNRRGEQKRIQLVIPPSTQEATE
ncbi:lipopolysaccharide transport periplasmic protein LptA [bacterium]|nr:lipopolysaccharide transport periplasmic protein LptA [Porticoccaceae bacterium]MDB9724671.1 lipopolysaccharide transport periplasmic protein LptA [bacterium]MDB9952390.1 lipopolysaccharide transport periplasmic protein LptA [Porticoccaceae bacterium]